MLGSTQKIDNDPRFDSSDWLSKSKDEECKDEEWIEKWQMDKHFLGPDLLVRFLFFFCFPSLVPFGSQNKRAELK